MSLTNDEERELLVDCSFAQSEEGIRAILLAADSALSRHAARCSTTSFREFRWLRRQQRAAVPLAAAAQIAAAPEETPERVDPIGGGWAVIVGGDEGETSAMFNLHLAFNLAVERLGRERVILIANVDHVRQELRRRAATGVPSFSPTLSYATNCERWSARARRFEELYAPVFESGGADYEEASAETVLRVLTGRRRHGHPRDKVVPPSGIDSLFFCLSGHGGSFRSVPRLSERLCTANCDLCGAPHRPRPLRDERRVARDWARWLQRDCNTFHAAPPSGRISPVSPVGSPDAASRVPGWVESDRMLVTGDRVLTPYGRGVVEGRQLVGARQRFGCEEAHRVRQRQRSTFEIEKDLARLNIEDTGASYNMPFVFFGLRPGAHRYVYRVRLERNGGGEGGDGVGGGKVKEGVASGGAAPRLERTSTFTFTGAADDPGGAEDEAVPRLARTPLGRGLALLHAFSLLSYHAAVLAERAAAARLGAAASAPERWLGRHCPPRALRCLIEYIGSSDPSCCNFVRDALARDRVRASPCFGACASVFRRDCLCLAVGPAPEKHSHSSIAYVYVMKVVSLLHTNLRASTTGV